MSELTSGASFAPPSMAKAGLQPGLSHLLRYGPKEKHHD
jgi:hypothetical protein